MSETFPTRIAGSCVDCGTDMNLYHPDGIGGEGLAWPCPVCGNLMQVNGSDYIEGATR